MPGGSECRDCSFEVDRIPEHDRGDDEIQPAGSEALVVEGTVLDQTRAVEAHRAAQRVLGLTLVQTDRHAATELGALQPVQHEQRAVDAADLAPPPGQPVLTRVRGQLAQYQRGGRRSLANRRGQTRELVPLALDSPDVDPVADQRLEDGIAGGLLERVQALVGKIANAGSIPAERTFHQREGAAWACLV